MNKLIEVDKLCKNYSGFSLDNVTFSLATGRIMGFIGKNGAGKSTTLKTILNMVHPDNGTVKMFGKDYYINEKKCKEQIGVVFGGIDFYPLKKLSSITAVTKRFYTNWDDEDYQKYIKLFSLDESKKFKELSSGMKVKYLLTLALSHHAQLLILDEPTSGLDPVSRDELLHIFKRIVRDGNRSVLFSTHITSDLDRCADDITYIQNGKIIKSCDKETFMHSFNHLRTPQENCQLTLEEIMLRTERKDYDNETVI